MSREEGDEKRIEGLRYSQMPYQGGLSDKNKRVTRCPSGSKNSGLFRKEGPWE